MRLTRKHMMLIALTSLFILTNILLIYIDKEQKVAKTSYVKEWVEATETDMYETVDTKGVLDFSEESFVYFDENLGEFQSFLVDEGQEIGVGEALYSYEVRNYYETASQLEGEVEKLKGDISAIETAITRMESYQIPKIEAPGPSKVSPSIENDEDSISAGDSLVIRFEQEMNQAQDNGQAELIKEQYITEKEKELAQKKAEQNSVESQLLDLTSTGETVTVESPYEGVVTNISTTLEDPLLIIQSDELVVKGELTEREHLEVAPDQSVFISMSQSDVKEEGMIEEVSQLPKTINLKGKSRYPFTVTLVEEEIQEQEEQEQANDQDVDQDGEYEDTQEENGEQEQDQDQNSEQEPNQDQTNEQEDTLQLEEDVLVPGYHADLEIVTKESPEATVVDEDNLDGKSIWMMTPSGTIVKNPVKTGIQMGPVIEVTEGIGPGDWVAIELKDKFTSHSPFITSLDIKKVNANRLKSDRWFRDLMTGLISR